MMFADSTIVKAAIEVSNEANFERYAIYYTPAPQTALAQFGNRWFGWSYDDGWESCERSYFGIDEKTVRKITKAPCRYGLHGTLKAPFRLAPGTFETELRERISKFASGRKPFTLEGLRLVKIGSFLAFCPIGDLTPLNHLAIQCLFGFEDFRAPLAKEERARRDSSNLPISQRLNLELWGYPYVFGEFQFHLTLTGDLSDKEISEIKPIVFPALKDVCSEPFKIDAISLLGDPGNNQKFQLLGRFPMG